MILSTRPPTNPATAPQVTQVERTTELRMAKEDDELKRTYRSMRKAQAGDRLVEVRKPLGIVLKEDERGNVFVNEVVPGGNADKTGKVTEGDQVVMCSATFGDELWSTRGVGLESVMKAIKIRSGMTVNLVLENKNENAAKKLGAIFNFNQKEEKKADADKKEAERKALEKKIEEEDKDRKKKFLGLF